MSMGAVIVNTNIHTHTRKQIRMQRVWELFKTVPFRYVAPGVPKRGSDVCSITDLL